MKLKFGITVALVTIASLSAGAMYLRRNDGAPQVVTAPISRGSIVSAIAATGTLEAVKTVQVGTQVSGTVQTLYADFNSIVRKGQVLARLDPSLYQTQIDAARANLIRAEADLQRLNVALEDAATKAQRAEELSRRQLISAADLDAARVGRQLAQAQARSADAEVRQSRAALTQAEVNLQKTVIASPIDGIVIARNVDVGQTVAASLQAPTLFEIAADLTRMQVKANVDESDLGSIREGQAVSFRVDAYPDRTFSGTVTQVRLNPVVEQNVVTYAAIIDAPNAKLELKPGMTANVTIEVARRENVLRAPAAALRFRPDEGTLAALNQADLASTSAARTTAAGSTERPAAAGGATVWTFNGKFHPVTVRTGASDGTYVELLGEGLPEGTRLATRVTQLSSATRSTTTSSNPLMGPTPARRF